MPDGFVEVETDPWCDLSASRRVKIRAFYKAIESVINNLQNPKQLLDLREEWHSMCAQSYQDRCAIPAHYNDMLYHKIGKAYWELSSTDRFTLEVLGIIWS